LPNWAATTAATYEIARTFNDMMMPINETGLIQGAKKDAYTAISKRIFAYSEGRDRSRHSASGYASQQSSAGWYGIFFATSEKSFDDFARIANAQRDDGEYARCIDVPALTDGCDTIFDRATIASKREKASTWARTELRRLRAACKNHSGVAAHAFIRRLPNGWNEHAEFLKERVDEFVIAVNGNALTDVKQHAAKNFGVIYAGACLAIEKDVLPWDPKDLSASLRECFMDAMHGIRTSDDVLVGGQTKLREALQNGPLWPSVSAWPNSTNAIGFLKQEGGRKRYVAGTKEFRQLFEDEDQARAVLGWLHAEELLKISLGENESLEAGIWKGTTPRWPNGGAHRSYEFFDPFEADRATAARNGCNRKTGRKTLAR
jgi:hypothetical protein